jgi:hypothetical protein
MQMHLPVELLGGRNVRREVRVALAEHRQKAVAQAIFLAAANQWVD